MCHVPLVYATPLIIFLSLGLFSAPRSSPVAGMDEPRAAPPSCKYVMSDIGFEFEAPDGFMLRNGLWYHDGIRASLSFAYAKGKDFKAVVAEFTAEALWAAGQRLIEKKVVDVSGTKGLLVHISHGEGRTKKLGWVVVFPDDEGVCQIGAIFSAENAPGVEEAMRNVVLSVKRIRSRSSR